MILPAFHALALRLKLFKAPIGLMSIAASLAGSTAFLEKVTALSSLAALGTGFVATGALVLNNIQDRDIDRIMNRTMHRALPGGKIRLAEAAVISPVFILLGNVILMYASATSRVLIFSMAAVVLYNFLYTPLKRITPFSVIPGLASGAMPVYIGWIAAGGPLLSEKILFLLALMVLWQIPHTWITGLSCLEDHKRAGIRGAASSHPPAVMHKLIFLWAAAFAVAAMNLPLLGITVSAASLVLITLNALTIIGIFAYVIFAENERAPYPVIFSSINISIMILHIIIITDRIPLPHLISLIQ